MKDKIKQISKIALLWCGALFVVVFFFLSGNSIRENIDTFIVCLLLPIVICLFFAPTIIFLIFLCKKLNSKKWKIFWISFLIPFTNMIYYIAIHLPFAHDWGLGTMVLGLLSMLLIPVLFVLTIITPSKWLKLKKEFLITEILMLFIGGILIFTTLTAEGIIYDKRIFTGPQGRIADTVVNCEWSDACREIHKMFEKQNDKCQGFMGPTF